MLVGRLASCRARSPPTLTKAEQQSLLAVSATRPRDHPVFSLAHGTGPRLSEIVGLNVGDVFTATGAREAESGFGEGSPTGPRRRRIPAGCAEVGGPWSETSGHEYAISGTLARDRNHC